MTETDKGFFSAEDLSRISPIDRPAFYLSFFEVALDELKEDNKISEYHRAPESNKEDKPNFFVTSRTGKTSPFKVTERVSDAIRIHYKYPELFTICIMDLKRNTRTKDIETLKNDVLRRL